MFLRDWGAHFADQWFPFLCNVLVEVKHVCSDSSGSGNGNGNGTATVLINNSRLKSVKANIEKWLNKINALLALYTKVEDDVDNNNNSGQVNWLSNIRTMEVKWLGVRVNISDWKKYSKALSSARVSFD